MCFLVILAIWNQYDAAIFPEPTRMESFRNYMPGIKVMDPVHSRELATLAMLPRWEGFCTDNQGGIKMTGLEAVRRVTDVLDCMTSSHSVEHSNVYYSYSDVPSGYKCEEVKCGTQPFFDI